MRKAIIAASAAALLIAVYAAAGYWLAPRFVHDAMVEGAARLGLVLELGEIRTDPFALRVTLNDVRVLAGGRQLARVARVDADLAWSSVWGEAWRVQQAALHEPRAEVTLGPKGELNWPAARRGNRSPDSEGSLPLRLQQLSVSNGALHFVDRSRAAPVEVRFEAISLRAGGLSTLQGERGYYELQARTAGGGSLSTQGNLILEPLSVEGKLHLAQVPLGTVWSLAAPASDPGSGPVGGSASYAYDGKQLVFSEVALSGRGLAYGGMELSELVLRSPRIPLPLEAPFQVSGTAVIAPEGRLSASGTIGIGPFSAELQAKADGVALTQANRWLPDDLALRIASGRLFADGQLRISGQGVRYEGALAARDARLEERDSGGLLLAWEALETKEAVLATAPFRAALGQVVAQAPAGRLVVHEDRQTNFAQLLGRHRAAAKGAASHETPAQVSIAHLEVRNGSLELDHSTLPLAVQDIDGAMTGFSTATDQPAKVELRSARIVVPKEEAIPLRASGTLATQPLAADLQLEIDNLPLPLANRWLPDTVALTLVSGRLAANGRVRAGQSGVRYEGALAVRDARIEERGSGQLLLAWDRLETHEAAFALGPFSAQLGELVAQAPRGRLVIERNGQLNFAKLRQEDPGGAQGVPLQIAVRRLRIEDGIVEFADRSLENDFAVTIGELAGVVSGFSTAPGNPARVQLKGRVGEYGAARIAGSVNLDEPRSLTDIRATFRNLDLAALTPYVVRFAGYRVESGRVSAELRYRVRDGRLVGENQLSFEQLQLGEKVQRAGARDLPLELAVALLADAKGRINLDIPVSGNLNDPQFDFGGLVARALGNMVGKIVSAPFRALAGVFGRGGEDLDRIAFAPGSAALSPPAEENVARVAKALAERPRLSVVVQGGYDAKADLAALRRNAARRAIAQRAGVEAEKPLDFEDPKVLQAAERLYLERVGNRLQMLELREKEPRYGRALLERLAASLQAEAQDAQTLARARAEMVRAELFSHGIAPSRVRLDAPDSRQAGKEGVPTVLALDAGRGATAGGTR